MPVTPAGPERFLVALWLGFSAAVPWLPGLGAPGYLQAFVTNVVLVAVLPALLMRVADRVDLRWRGAWTSAVGGVLAALPALWSTAWGAAQGGLCSWQPAWLHVVLGPVLSAVWVGALAGLLSTVASRGWGRAATLAGLLLLFMVPSWWTLYQHPQAFSANHVYGFFRGPLYDEGQPPLEPLMALRAQTVAWVLVFWALAGVAQHPRKPALVALVASSLVVLGATHLWCSPVVNPGRQAVLRDLSVRTAGRWVVVHSAPDRMEAGMLGRVVMEADRHVEELSAALGLPQAPTVQVFLYPSAEEKLRLIGASGTLLARPWQNEIHVQGNTLPIPALRHELAHVVLGKLVDGVFDVPTLLPGIPHVLLVEGMATALEDPRADLTLMQRAALQLQMGRLPSMDRLMSPWGFWSESGPRAYTAAGAFLRFVGDTQGFAVLARLYATGSWSGLDVATVESAWRAHLATVEVPAQHTGGARRALDRGSLWERRCVDDAPALWSAAHSAAAHGALDEAESIWRTLMDWEPNSDAPLLALLEAAAARGDADRTQRLGEELLENPPDDEARSRVLGAGAELKLRAADWPGALEPLQRALELAQSDGRRRQLAVMLVAAQGAAVPERGCEHAVAVLRFLMGQGPERARGRSDLLALERARQNMPRGNQACGGQGPRVRAVLAYLMGRQLVPDDPARAQPLLEEALLLGLEHAALEREAWRLRGEAAEAAGDARLAPTFYARMLNAESTAAQREEAAMLTARAEYAAAYGKAPPRAEK